MINTSKLTKKFGDFTAVDKLGLDVAKGEVFGLLGPNGAGKTTTISMLITLVEPTSGTATVNGFDIVTQKSDVRKSIGIVFQEPSVDDLLTGRENLEMHAKLYCMPREIRKKRIREALELVELTERADSFVKTYSGGMRRRLELARGLLHRPKVMFLDEPTLGLDPQTREHIWMFIRKLNKEEKMTILLTTHYMEEADTLCDRIGVIDSGKIRVLGTPKELKRAIGGDTVVIRKKGFDRKKLRGLSFVKSIAQNGSETILGVQDAHSNLQKLLARIGPIDSVEVREASLTDVFLKYTGKKFRDEGEDGGEGGWGNRVMHQSNVRG